MESIVRWMERVFHWVQIGLLLLLTTWVFIALPMLIFRRTRPAAALFLAYSSYYSGLNCWCYCFIVCYRVLGGWALVTGLLFWGVGVVPMAFIGLLIKSISTNGLGSIIVDIVVAILLTFVPRIFGVRIRIREQARQLAAALKE